MAWVGRVRLEGKARPIRAPWEPSVDLFCRRAGGGGKGVLCKQYVALGTARRVRCVAVKLKLGEICLRRYTGRGC